MTANAPQRQTPDTRRQVANLACMAITLERVGALGVLRFDDGKANVLSHAAIDELHSHLDALESDKSIGATVLIGRPGRFCAGFDLATMTASAEDMRSLVSAGGRLIARLLLHPTPLVGACSGHALAAGALLLLACDERIAVAGDWKIGLNEVNIGMALPTWAVELARYRLAASQFDQRVILGEVAGPDDAVRAGFADRVVEPDVLELTAMERAERLAGLHRSSVALTKRRSRAGVAASMTDGIDAEMATMRQPSM